MVSKSINKVINSDLNIVVDSMLKRLAMRENTKIAALNSRNYWPYFIEINSTSNQSILNRASSFALAVPLIAFSWLSCAESRKTK